METWLPEEFEAFVKAKVESGEYNCDTEVIAHAMDLLIEWDAIQQRRLGELRKMIAVGIEEADRGECKPFDDAAVEEIITRGREMLASRTRKKLSA